MNLLAQSKSLIREEELLYFLKQLSYLLNAGLQLTQSLHLLAQAEQNAGLRQLMLYICQVLEQGREFHQSLKPYPQHFDALTLQLIRIGEHSGRLSQMLEQVALIKERKLAFKNQMKECLIYPALVIAAALISTLSLVLFVVPQFALLYEQLPHQLPPLTQSLINLSQNLNQNGIWPILGLGPAILWLKSKWKSPPFRACCEEKLSKLPYLKQLFHKIRLARFARTLAFTLSAAIPLSEALILTSQLFSHRSFAKQLLILHREVQTGKRFYACLALDSSFPPLLIQMVKTGEESGNLENMLDHFAKLLEEQVQRTTQRFNQLLPPLIILILGVLIGIVVVALYLPIFHLGMAVE